MLKKAELFDARLKGAITAVTSRTFKNLTPTPLTVSTISAISVLNADRIKLKRVIRRFDEDDVQVG